jgi:hypothetical protein
MHLYQLTSTSTSKIMNMNNDFFNSPFFNTSNLSQFTEFAARAQAKLEEVNAKRIGEITVVIAAAGSRGGRFEDSYDMTLGGIIGTVSSTKGDAPDCKLTVHLEDGETAELPFSSMKDKKILVNLSKEQLTQIKTQFNALPAFRESGGRAGQFTIVVDSEIQVGESTDLSGTNVLMFSLTPLIVGEVKATQRAMGVSNKAALDELLRNSDAVANETRRNSMARTIERRQRRRDTIQANNAPTDQANAPTGDEANNAPTGDDKLAAMDNVSGQP